MSEPTDKAENNIRISYEHYDLLKSYFEHIPGVENFPDKVGLLATSGYGAAENEIFSTGIDISLWDLEGKLVIIANSSDEMILMGSIRRNSDRMESFYSNILEASRPVPTVQVLRRQRNQPTWENTMRDWAKYWQKGAAKGILAEFDQLMSYSVSGAKTDYEKYAIEDKHSDLLLFTVYCALVMYKNRVVDTEFEAQPEMIEWFKKNLNLSEL